MPPAPLDAEGGGSNMLPLEGGGRRGPPTLKNYPVKIIYQIKVTECLPIFLHVRYDFANSRTNSFTIFTEGLFKLFEKKSSDKEKKMKEFKPP